jgi:hypothetical protein
LAHHLQVKLIKPRAQLIFPCGLQILKVSLFLVCFGNRLFINIALEVLPTLPMMQEDIDFPQYAPLTECEEREPLMLLHGAIPLACGSFELPSCARCFLGYACKTHICDEEK